MGHTGRGDLAKASPYHKRIGYHKNVAQNHQSQKFDVNKR